MTGANVIIKFFCTFLTKLKRLNVFAKVLAWRVSSRSKASYLSRRRKRIRPALRFASNIKTRGLVLGHLLGSFRVIMAGTHVIVGLFRSALSKLERFGIISELLACIVLSG